MIRILLILIIIIVIRIEIIIKVIIIVRVIIIIRTKRTIIRIIWTETKEQFNSSSLVCIWVLKFNVKLVPHEH